MATQTIKVKKFNDVVIERAAAAVIIPGNVLELTSSDTVQKCATAAGKWAYLIALEDALQGKGINDNYAAGDRVQVWVAGKGDVALLLLEDEQTIVIGDFIELATGGRVRKFTSGVAIGIAVEAKDLSSFPEGSESSAAGAYYNPRLKVMLY
jgi:hypothetical protein